jgi:hypothetical protein
LLSWPCFTCKRCYFVVGRPKELDSPSPRARHRISCTTCHLPSTKVRGELDFCPAQKLSHLAYKARLRPHLFHLRPLPSSVPTSHLQDISLASKQPYQSTINLQTSARCLTPRRLPAESPPTRVSPQAGPSTKSYVYVPTRTAPMLTLTPARLPPLFHGVQRVEARFQRKFRISR